MRVRSAFGSVPFMADPDPQPKPRCGLVLLAAGASTRMGRPKQLLEVNGRPLLERAVLAGLATPVWPVIVVLGAHADAIRPLLARHPVLIAENPAWTEGMASSLRAGLATLSAFSPRIDAVIVGLCDQPAFSEETIGRLLSAHRETGRDLVAARYQGRLGAPALFGRTHFPALASLTGDEGARKLIAGVPSDGIAAVDLPELAFDLDTPDDLARLASTRKT